MTRRALVLGGGGVAGIAWETGMIVGLADAGLDLRAADLYVGTSAGSIVGAQINSGLAAEELFQRQVDPRLQARELTPAVDLNQWYADMAAAVQGGGPDAGVLRRIGALALAAPTVPPAERRAAIVSRLPTQAWPERRLLVVAVDAESGERRVFDRDAGVELVDALAASCAVPGIWPCVSIQGRKYMDGGVYSAENADLAAGYERVLIIALRPREPSFAVQSLADAVRALRAAGAQVEVLHPDQATEAAFASVGGNLLDPAIRERAAWTGRRQGAGAALETAASVWR